MESGERLHVDQSGEAVWVEVDGRFFKSDILALVNEV